VKPLSFRIRAELFAQLAQMESAGVPFDRAFETLRLPPPERARIDGLRRLYSSGTELAAAGEKSGLFTKLEARLIRAALHGGSPAAMYRRLADHYGARATQLATMKSRMSIPLFVLLLALCIQPLPQLVGGSISAVAYVWKITAPVLLVFIAYRLMCWMAEQDARSVAKSLWQRVPIYGPMFVRRNLRDYFESLALMLEAGVAMLDALPAALDTVEDGDMRRALAGVRRLVERGATFAQALEGVAYIRDERVIHFVQTGEASGTLPEMLLRHCRLETEAINLFWEQLAQWAPRVLYGLVMAWMVYGLLTGGGVLPRVPKEL